MQENPTSRRGCIDWALSFERLCNLLWLRFLTDSHASAGLSKRPATSNLELAAHPPSYSSYRKPAGSAPKTGGF